jgi:CBS domain-containing protein
MTTELVTASPLMSTLEAIQLMRDNRVSCLPVVDKRNRLVGIVTERDFMSIAGQLLEAYLS